MSAFKDVVVLLPGITGSVLAAHDGREVWSPSAGAIWRVVTSVGHSIDDLELDPSGDPRGVTAPRLIPDVSIVPGLIKIDGYTRIEGHLVSSLGLKPGENYFPFPYDWRLDNRVNAQRLHDFALARLEQWRASSGAADAKLVLVGHSMGGLVSRYFVECLGGWQQTRRLVTIGTPHQGSLNALDALENGLKKGIGVFGLDLSPLLRSFPSMYQLLPIFRCVEAGGAPGHVADAARDGLLQQVKEKRARDARAFHQEIEDAQARNVRHGNYAADYRCVPMVGIEQPTLQSARVAGGRIELLRSFNGNDDGGDGTVPRVCATPIELEKQGREIYAAEMHGSLQNADGNLTNLTGLLLEPSTDLSKFRKVPPWLTLDMDDFVAPGEPLLVRARASQGNPIIRVVFTLVNAGGGAPISEKLGSGRDGWRQSEFRLPPGTWRVRIEADGVTPVTDLVAVSAP